MCQRTVIKSVKIPQGAIAVHVSAGINCPLMENPVWVSPSVKH